MKGFGGGFRVVRFWGSCLIIYLYNLQKKGLAKRGGLPSTSCHGNTVGQELFF